MSTFNLFLYQIATGIASRGSVHAVLCTKYYVISAITAFVVVNLIIYS